MRFGYRIHLTSCAYLILICILPFPSCKERATAQDWVGVDTEATEESEWTLQAVTADSARVPIFSVQREPVLIEHSKELVEAQVSCGSPCSYSYFVDLAADSVSQAFEYVVGINVNRGVVATAGKDAISLHYILQGTDALKRIELDFAPVSALVTAIEVVRFTEDEDLYIRYLSGEEFETKKDTVYITYKNQNKTND